jgi:Uma2 family endonuclease
MSIATPAPATLDDLMKVEGKAELIGGRIVRYMPSGYRPNRCAFKIAMSLENWSVKASRGTVGTDGLGFAIRPPLKSGRQSFSPDTSYYLGPLPQQEMKFIDGPPLLAVEVRSDTDYTKKAEREMAAKRADYFEAGTQIVWDVDPLAKEVRSYSAASPDQPRTFKAGEVADAEPALPGWRIAVDEVFA